MSSKRNRHLMLRKTMAGLLSMAMVVTIVTPASGNAYASALDEETAKAVLEQVAGTFRFRDPGSRTCSGGRSSGRGCGRSSS